MFHFTQNVYERTEEGAEQCSAQYYNTSMCAHFTVAQLHMTSFRVRQPSAKLTQKFSAPIDLENSMEERARARERSLAHLIESGYRRVSGRANAITHAWQIGIPVVGMVQYVGHW